MDKTQKKCLVGSAFAHILLVAMVGIFAGFSQKSNDTETFTQITIVDLDKVMVTDGPTRGGGSGTLPPVVVPPQPRQAQPPPQQLRVQPQPPAPTMRNSGVKDDGEQPTSQRMRGSRSPVSDSGDVSIDGKLPPRGNSGIRISTNLVVRKGGSTKTQSSSGKIAGNKIADQFNSAIQNIGAGLTSGGLHINDVPGFGGGGPAMVNYTQLIMNIFDRAWTPPSEIADENLITEVSIVIHRTGKVTSTRILKRSGNAAMDASVLKAIESVRSVPAFPSEARDFERTFIIEFNLKTKLSRG